MTSSTTKQRSREIAELLMKSMSMPNDAAQVSALGNGDEPCNLDAMTTFVNAYANEIDPEEAMRRLKGSSR